MAEVDEFLETMLPRQLSAEHALCRGDVEARAARWSLKDPVTLFGAAVPLRRGWDAVNRTFVVDGEPATYTLRVTHVYRREGGEWRIVHCHGDFPLA